MNTDSGMTSRVTDLLCAVLQIEPPPPGTDLIEAGLLDSIGFMNLFVAMEKEFGIGVTAADLSPDSFRTVERIAAFVAAKQGPAMAEQGNTLAEQDPTGAETVLTDPRTGHERRRIALSGEPEVAAAVAESRAAAASWASLAPRDRARRLLRFADLIEERSAEYAEAERAGTGKPAAEAAGEVENCADLLRFSAGAVRAGVSPAGGHYLPGRESWVRWEPLGVIGVIVPWNYPLMMAAWRIGPALATGNTVVLKPALTTPDTALLLARDAATTLGPGVLLTVPGDRDTGRLLVESDIDAVAFTGSEAGGRDIVARAGLRRVSLELGGNCPALVLPDAPPDTYEALVRAATYNAGQSCAAPARVITLRENYLETVEGLAKAMADRRAGVHFGPLNNADQAARYDRIVGRSAAGIEHIAPLAPPPGEEGGHWRPGRVLADLPPDDPAVLEEVFAPVLTVQAADGHAEALALANSVPQALAGSVWGSRTDEVLELAGGLNAGEVWVNCHLEQTAELPHGGRGSSGHGTDMSVLALTEYQRPKTVTVRVGRG
ncbi:aldehyde dehydrogenase family protein [Streptomyces rhizosphaericus]|uniref:Aldehyde dehydrogenase family protein n=1 Tax=Streptomyces rhizosphaericus TaxID=114699 RepID=A0A6G4A983_9ACTN|nr:aldehyde dehydrogenase family protein [Streptomyces rhizosphaericus]NEW69768.1 aldehyde dehydrogenase family protein [Streptomyces rhizosphaericus]